MLWARLAKGSVRRSLMEWPEGGCQRDIAQKIIDKKADYVLALKGNQGSLREDVEIFVAEQEAVGFKDCEISQHRTIDGDHDRIETRITTVIHDVGWLQDRHGWPGMKAVVMVESSREISGKIERETRFYLTSLLMLAHLIGPAIRSHWASEHASEGIENSLHWVMDMLFRDDECRVRTDHAPANFTTIKHMAHNLLRKASGKTSLRSRRRPPDGTTTSWQATSRRENLTRFPWTSAPQTAMK
jgi:predicted transposase YbfD/YdcC